MQKNVLGIDIGNFNIKIVEGAPSGNKMQIINYDIAKTPVGSINDGKITDADNMIHALKSLLHKGHLSAKRAVGVVSSSALVTREVNIPKMQEKDISKYISVDSQQYFPMDLSNYVMDYKLLGEVHGKDGVEYNILLAAAPVSLINDYVAVFDRLGLDLAALDITPNALSKFGTAYLSNNQAGTYAIIDLGAANTTINIISNGILQFNRTIPTGANEITQSVASTFNLEMEEAEDYKLKNAEISLDGQSANGMSDIVKPIMDGIVSQINKFLEFYYSRGSSKLSQIYLTGGGSLVKGMDTYIQAMFNVPTRRLDFNDGNMNRSRKASAQFDMPIILNAFSGTFREK